MTRAHKNTDRSIDISIGDAKKHFSELVSRALAGERFRVRRRNKIVAAIVGPEDLSGLELRRMNALREARLLGQRTEILSAIETGDAHPAMAAFGLLAGDEEWDSILEDAYRNRGRKSTRRAVEL
jgi:antitoxin (DNA-binding transcriptional repressor) of toxin-antitoxin stability system